MILSNPITLAVMFCNCFSTLLDQSPGSSYTTPPSSPARFSISQFINDEQASNSIISSLLYICSERTEKKIELYLNIPGAVLRPVLAIYDVINELKADGVEIATVNAAL